MNRYPHKVECAIRALKHSAAACDKLGTFLVEQQLPEFEMQGYLFAEAAGELKKALKWAHQGRTLPKHSE